MANYRINVATAAHKGDREYQQDRVQVLQHPYEKRCLMVIVADGMGGRSGGAMASEQVIDSARQLLQQYDLKTDNPRNVLRQLVADAHSVIRMLNISSEHEPHTTIAAYLLLPDGECHWIHSGDSRIYYFRRGKLVSRTVDHSYVQSLMDQGLITEAEALHHPQSNLLIGCLGMPTEPPIAEYAMGTLGAEEVLLSCSDGLWGYLQEKELAKITSSLTPTEACQHLISLARERARGGGDNISIAILKSSPTENREPQNTAPPDTEQMLNFKW